MTYVIVTQDHTITSQPLPSYDEALAEANREFGDDIEVWLELNIRIEENR